MLTMARSANAASLLTTAEIEQYIISACSITSRRAVIGRSGCEQTLINKGFRGS